MENEEPKESTEETPKVGSTLMSALFDAAESEPVDTSPLEQVLSVSDAIEQATREVEDVKDDAPETTEEAVEPETEKPKVKKVDRTLFELPESEPILDAPQPEPEPAPVSEPEKPETEGLTKEQLRRYELATFAEENFPEHQGLSKKYLEFFQKQKEYIDNRLSEDPEANLNDDDYEYQNFLKRFKPKFEQDDFEKVIEARTLAKATEKVRSDMEPQLQELKRQQQKLEIAPRVSSLKGKSIEDIKGIIPEHIRKDIESVGAEQAFNNNPMEYEVVNNIITAHQDVVFAFHEISQGLEDYNPSNQTHVRLATWLDQLQATMPDQDGRQYVRREEFYKLPASKKNSAYTLSDEDVVLRAHEAAGKFINYELNKLQQRMEKSGYVKSSGNPAAQTIQPSPKPLKPSPRQGHTTEVKQSEQKSSTLTSVLGL